jgi:WD40 repeat protein
MVSMVHLRIAHIDQVYQLDWRPTKEGIATQLASCSEDGTLKILDVKTEDDSREQ